MGLKVSSLQRLFGSFRLGPSSRYRAARPALTAALYPLPDVTTTDIQFRHIDATSHSTRYLWVVWDIPVLLLRYDYCALQSLLEHLMSFHPSPASKLVARATRTPAAFQRYFPILPLMIDDIAWQYNAGLLCIPGVAFHERTWVDLDTIASHDLLYLLENAYFLIQGHGRYHAQHLTGGRYPRGF